MTTHLPAGLHGWELFARFAFPPNELGYCGPPDATVLLPGGGRDEIVGHAQGFDGAWPYLEEIAAAAGIDDPMDAEVVRSYWVGGPLLDTEHHEHSTRLRAAAGPAHRPAGPSRRAWPGSPQLPRVRRLPVDTVAQPGPGHTAADSAGLPDPLGRGRFSRRRARCDHFAPTGVRRSALARRSGRGNRAVADRRRHCADAAAGPGCNRCRALGLGLRHPRRERRRRPRRGHRVDDGSGQPAARAVTSRYSHSSVPVAAVPVGRSTRAGRARPGGRGRRRCHGRPR